MRRVLVGTAVTLALAGAYAAAGDLDAHRGRLGVLVVGWWATFALVARWATSGPPPRLRRPALTIAALAFLVQLPGLAAPPRSSSDAYRYVWDGRVQLAGISPYRYVPLDDRLARLRDPVLFPGLGPQQRSGVVTRALPSSHSAVLARARNDPRTRINRPDVPTIYPPLAEAWFLGVAAVTPWRAGTLGLQLGAALAAASVAGLLAHLLARRGRAPTTALWWAWCPTVVAEAGNGAHVDVVATAAVVGALALAEAALRQRTTRRVLPWLGAGALLGLAAAVKLTPLALLPALMPWRALGRRVLLAPAAAAVTLVLAYLPYARTAGLLVVGYLPGYLAEEDGPNRAASLALLLPRSAAELVAVAVVIALAVAVVVGRPPSPSRAGLWLSGTVLLAFTPTYGWYALPLIALAALTTRPAWLVVAAAAAVAYASAAVPPVPALVYAAAALVLGALLVRARRRGGGPTRWEPAYAGLGAAGGSPGVRRS